MQPGKLVPLVCAIAFCTGAADAQEDLKTLSATISELCRKGDYAEASKVAELSQINRLTNLSVQQAEAYATLELLSLNGLAGLSDEVAAALARQKGGLYLNGLTHLSDNAARALASHQGGLWLNGLTTLSRASAEALSRHDGILVLHGLTTVSADVADALAKHEDLLSLNGVTSLSDSAALALAKHQQRLWLDGLTELTAKTAACLSSHSGGLSLNGLTRLSAEAAAALAKTKGGISLNGLIELPAPVAVEMAKHPDDLVLDGLVTLSEEAAAALSHHSGPLLLNGLTTLSEAAAAALARHRGFVFLSGLTDLTAMSASELTGNPLVRLPDEFRAGPLVPHKRLDELESRTHLFRELYRAGDYAKAAQVAEQAFGIAEHRFGKEAPETDLHRANLGMALYNQGKYAEAEPLLKESLSIRERTLEGEHEAIAISLGNLAMLYRLQGQHDRAVQLFQRALTIYENTLGPSHSGTALAINNLAATYCEQGKYPLAEDLFKRSLAISTEATDRDANLTAAGLVNLAMTYAAQGKFAEAIPLLARSVAIREEKLGPDHSDTATSLNALARLYDIQAEYDEAMPLYKRALAIREKTLGPDHPDTAGSLDSLATIDVTVGHLSDATKLFDRSRRGTRGFVTRVLPSLSAVEQALFLRARDEMGYHRALSLGLLLKSNPQIASLSAGWLANAKAAGQEAASQQIILARQSHNPATKEAVNSLAHVRTELAKLAQMTPSLEQAAAYRAKLASLQDDEQKLVHEIGGQLAALDRDEPWVEIDAIRKNIPAGSVVVDIARFGIFDFKARGKDPKWQPARYAAWVVPPAGKGDIKILDLGSAEEIDAAVAAYREAIKAVEGGVFKRGQATAEDELKVTAAPLAHKVLQPIIDSIGPATDIILSPDGALWLVPWQALPLADGSYAIEKYSIRTVTSGRDLVPPPDYAKARTGSSRGPVVVADPAFDAAPPASGSSSEPQSRALAPAGRVIQSAKRLPATLAEARASAVALQKIFSREPKQLTGSSATEDNLKREAVRPPALVLATHGFFLPDQVAKRDDSAGLGGSGTRGTRAVTASGEPIEDPLLRCGLLLAGANLTAAGKTLPGDDGILTGAEIVGLDLLGTDLVVLSACQTGVGKVNTGEGVAGLRQAFQIAGAKSVVATLWTVPDAESGQIMQGFYANVAKGQPPSKALREAQLAFIKARREDRAAGEAAHPYLWAAYGVTGR